MEPKIYLLWRTGRRTKGGGYSVVEITRIGQRYVEMAQMLPAIYRGVFSPEYLYTAREVSWHRSASAAARAANALQRKAGAAPWNIIGQPTSTASGGGPGFYKLDPNGGPLMSVIGLPNEVDRSPLPPIHWNDQKGNT